MSCQCLLSLKSSQLLQRSCKGCIYCPIAIRGTIVSQLMQSQSSQFLLPRSLLICTAQSWLNALLASLVSSKVCLYAAGTALLHTCVFSQEDWSRSACIARMHAKHCVPATPADLHNMCNKCTAPWDSSDPVAQYWCVQRNAILASQQSSQQVPVYYRRCSNRCALMHPWEFKVDISLLLSPLALANRQDCDVHDT